MEWLRTYRTIPVLVTRCSFPIFRTAGVAIFLSLYLQKHNTPVPIWTPKVGFRIIWYPLHQVFSVSHTYAFSNNICRHRLVYILSNTQKSLHVIVACPCCNRVEKISLHYLFSKRLNLWLCHDLIHFCRDLEN